MVSWLTEYLGNDSPYVNAMAIPVAISLFHTTFNIANTFLLVWFVDPISKIVERMVPEVAMQEKAIEQPKYLSSDVLKYPETAIAAITQETQYLFKNAIFQIVSHALSISRTDIKSDLKVKKVIKKSTTVFDTDVRELYQTKVKTIYGKIISYATKAQSALVLNEMQNNQILEVKVANRKMVEILKDVLELSRNVNQYLNSDNEHIKKEYNKLRNRTVKVSRTIHLFRTAEDNQLHHEKLIKLKNEIVEKPITSNRSVNDLIKNDLISVEMASSLFNDYDNVNNMIDKLIQVAELLYGKKDTLIENNSN